MNTCIKVPEFVTQIHFQKASFYDCGVFSSNKIRGLHLLTKKNLTIFCLQNKGHLKVLNGTKLILKDFGWPLHYLGWIRYHSKNPIFHQRKTCRELLVSTIFWNSSTLLNTLVCSFTEELMSCKT